MRIKPLFAWYDLWVGFFYDRKGKRLYVLPLPMLGVVIDFTRRARSERTACRMISLAERLSDKDLRDFGRYCESLLANRAARKGGGA